jgi:hypothetical protein
VRRLKSSVKHWTSVLKDYKRCKVKVAEAMQQLVEAKKQISDLNRAMNFLLKQPPKNGHLFDEVCDSQNYTRFISLADDLDTTSVGACGCSGRRRLDSEGGEQSFGEQDVRWHGTWKLGILL